MFKYNLGITEITTQKNYDILQNCRVFIKAMHSWHDLTILQVKQLFMSENKHIEDGLQHQHNKVLDNKLWIGSAKSRK